MNSIAEHLQQLDEDTSVKIFYSATTHMETPVSKITFHSHHMEMLNKQSKILLIPYSAVTAIVVGE